jgi:hypothetical protein
MEREPRERGERFCGLLVVATVVLYTAGVLSPKINKFGSN